VGTQLLLRLIGMPDARVTNTNSQRILRDKISASIPPLSNGGHPLVARDVEHVSVGHIVCRGHEVHQRIHNLCYDAHVTARVALDLLAQVLPERGESKAIWLHLKHASHLTESPCSCTSSSRMVKVDKLRRRSWVTWMR